MRSTVGLVFQNPVDQIVSSVVEEDVAFGPENLGLSPERIASRVDRALARTGLESERRRPVRFLSSGQQQRLAIAGALALEPRCMAFDEATAMLDPAARAGILDLMDDLDRSGLAIVHVTHDTAEAARARRVLVFEGGRIVHDGDAASFFSGEDCTRFGFPPPPGVRAARIFGIPPVPGESVGRLAERLAAARPEITGADVVAALAGASGSDAGELRAGLPREAVPLRAAGPDPREGPHGNAFELGDVSLSWLRGTIHERSALRGVTMTVPRGSLVALVGRTGSGKSSLLQVLDGLASPDSGTVRSLGILVSGTGDQAPGEGASGRGGGWRGRHAARIERRAARRERTAGILALRTRGPLAIQRPETALFELLERAGTDLFRAALPLLKRS